MNVVSFYRFTDIVDVPTLCRQLQSSCDQKQLVGTVLVAPEGVNGTLAGHITDIESILGWLKTELALATPIEGRWAEAGVAPFRRMRVRVKKEIVALGRTDIRPSEVGAKHVGVEEWNKLINDPEVLVIDTRNHYEFEVGTFKNAVDPQTQSFREFPEYAKQLAKINPGQKLAMFCTGGIRCEKATALMEELGFNEVFQLDGGILKYLEEVSPDDNLWRGDCFVFDMRVSVDRGLAEGSYLQCHACRRPLSPEDLKSPDYCESISCPKCIDLLDGRKLERLEERRKQVMLARQRGKAHIGATFD